MPTLGTPHREWMLLLIACSIAHTTATGASELSSNTTSVPTAALLPSSTPTRNYSDTNSNCPFRTINYITHTLPQQCARTSWSAPDEKHAANADIGTAHPTHHAQAHASGQREQGNEVHVSTQEQGDGTSQTTSDQDISPASVDEARGSTSASTDSDGELETDSPLDNANFLSFDEWKKRNLAQAGQSPENVGQGRAPHSNRPERRRPVNVNALDSLGEEGEIEIDFTGFGPPDEGGHVARNIRAGPQDPGANQGLAEDGKMAPSSWALSKDAGKTCKERFNYASFDCAATVLKTNKQAKSSSSVLVENKDSYMLNQCAAENKFLIVELCDDILVDTVVLANYEFFSSMFRHFRISVSDRYPVKMERWRILGTFEARNTRDIQPFLITEPQIWARYLRVEFLTQFGNEFYCPLSLLRVHGTTMMEQFRREEEGSRGLDDDDGDLEAELRDKSVMDNGPLPLEPLPIGPLDDEPSISPLNVSIDLAKSSTLGTNTSMASDGEWQSTASSPSIVGSSATTTPTPIATDSVHDTMSIEGSARAPTVTANSNVQSDISKLETDHGTQSSLTSVVTSNAQMMNHDYATTSISSDPSTPLLNAPSDAHRRESSNTSASIPSSYPAVVRPTGNHTGSHVQPQLPRGSPVQPNPPVPSTQESFYKSIHKRLLYLEANSTLSLQYIEEQSRILRDAFIKVERRQLAKTEKFLDHLNSTVMQELKSYRTMYDQLWQSTIIELESMKERQNSEMGEVSTRLSLMADELVWQKRMAVVQSTLLLLCLGLVLFVRSGTLGTTSDVPVAQQIGSKYSSIFELSPQRSLANSGMARRRRTFRDMWRSDTSAGLSDHQSDGQNVSSDVEADVPQCRNQDEGISASPDTPTVLETQSGPATPNGTRDSRPSWEEVDRAIDQLKADEQGLSATVSTEHDGKRRQKRSPLRRAHSSYDGTADEALSADESVDMFEQ
ncbi:hypothetical protein ACN47E_001032 [Coniothyrium glycines]